MLAENDSIYEELFLRLQHGHILACIDKLLNGIWPRLLLCNALEDIVGVNWGLSQSKTSNNHILTFEF